MGDVCLCATKLGAGTSCFNSSFECVNDFYELGTPRAF